MLGCLRIVNPRKLRQHIVPWSSIFPLKYQKLEESITTVTMSLHVPRGTVYTALRIPIFLLASASILFEAIIYVCVRVLVVLYETLSWKHRHVRLAMDQANDYDSWFQAASEMDQVKSSSLSPPIEKTKQKELLLILHSQIPRIYFQFFFSRRLFKPLDHCRLQKSRTHHPTTSCKKSPKSSQML
jgi:hypothetical protein